MLDLPPALDELVHRIQRHDPALGDEAADALGRLLIAARALAWARDRAPRLARADGEGAVLDEVVAIAREATGAPEVWALGLRDRLASRHSHPDDRRDLRVGVRLVVEPDR